MFWSLIDPVSPAQSPAPAQTQALSYTLFLTLLHYFYTLLLLQKSCKF